MEPTTAQIHTILRWQNLNFTLNSESLHFQKPSELILSIRKTIRKSIGLGWQRLETEDLNLLRLALIANFLPQTHYTSFGCSPHSTSGRRGCGCKTAASCPCSILPGLRCARGASQNGGGHPVNDGHFGIFAVSLLVFHFDFLLFFVYGVQFSNPNNTMRRRKRKYRRIVSNGAEFFRVIFA